MVRLLRHEAILDIENNPEEYVRDGVKFASRIFDTARVTLPVTRWIEMGNPSKIRVTVEPADERSPLGP
jgi:hypothetical protein